MTQLIDTNYNHRRTKVRGIAVLFRRPASTLTPARSNFILPSSRLLLPKNRKNGIMASPDLSLERILMSGLGSDSGSLFCEKSACMN